MLSRSLFGHLPKAAAVLFAVGGLASSRMVLAQAAVVSSDASSETASPVEQAETTQASGVSQVRIVRLSQVRGVAQMDRNTGRGFETAFANVPVVAGSRLRTAAGVAEVEFEDNSSLRLAPDSEVRFTELSRTAGGGTITVVSVVKGLAYVAMEKTRGNQFTVMDGAARVVLSPGTHLRLDATKPEAQLALFEGAAQLQMNGATTDVGKRETVDLNPTAQTISAARHGTEETDFDAWDKQEATYHKQKASLAGSGGLGLYGANDLNYYGSFANMPGCGSAWRPYFASAAWDPFASGVWAWYPNAGYSWVSPYPWGWLPYHSGSWVSCGAAGWGWQPGGQWFGLNNAVAMRIARHPLHPVPEPPTRNASTLVPVNMKALTVSGAAAEQAFTFRRDSAGLGVPRTTFGNLHGVSTSVERHGVARSTAATTSFSGAEASSGVTGLPTSTLRPSQGAGMTRSSSLASGMASSSSLRSAPMSAPSAGASMSAPSSGGAVSGGSHK